VLASVAVPVSVSSPHSTRTPQCPLAELLSLLPEGVLDGESKLAELSVADTV